MTNTLPSGLAACSGPSPAVSPRKLIGLAVVIALLLAGCVMLAGMVRARAEAASLDQAQATQARQQAATLVRSVVARSEFLADVAASDLGGELIAAPVEPVAAVNADAARIAGLLLPRMPQLGEIEARQLAEIDRLTGLADERAANAERAIRRVGLNPRLVVARLGDRGAQGGPLLSLAGLEPRLSQLGASLTRMSTLERGLDTIPSRLPASLEFISSGFGYRSDPFTGEGALHAGLDFRGPVGAPIQAAADGVVTFAGVKGGYGNCIEITHAGGLMTRYGHMSAFKATTGQKIAAGDTIGAIGSTGRSTGPHLHFEVRVNGQAVNPRPFLEARG